MNLENIEIIAEIIAKIQGMSTDLEKAPDVAIAFDVELPVVVTKKLHPTLKAITFTKECGHQSLMKFCKLAGNQRTQRINMLYAYWKMAKWLDI